MADEKLLLQVEEASGSTVLEALSGGGSPARCYKVTTRGQMQVLKAHSSLYGSVDGHDHLSLLRKYRQIEWLSTYYPDAGSLYVPMSLQVANTDLCITAMPYVDFASAASMRFDTTLLAETWHMALDAIYFSGWDQTWSEAPFKLDETFVHNRLQQRTRHLWHRLHESDRAIRTVNGEVLDQRAPNATVLDLYQSLNGAGSSVLNIHGDLNLGNLWRTQDGLRLSDPRGYIGRIDPLYDIGKALFSACAFEDLQDGDFQLAASDGNVELLIGAGSQEPSTAIAALMEATSDSSAGQHLEQTVHNWRGRLCLLVAVHSICEAACRFSCGDSASSNEAKLFERDKARALWFYGRLVLSRCLVELERQMTDRDVARLLSL